MIWIINHKSEYDPSMPTFRYYREVVGKENIKLFCAYDDERFDFIKKEDIVIPRSPDNQMIEKLTKKRNEIGFSSTIEDISTINLSYDKCGVKKVLNEQKIKTPKTYRIEDICESRKYFVKPIFGSDSNYIDEKSVCRTKEEVIKKYCELASAGVSPMIEEYIDGIDVTVAVIKTDRVNVYPIDIDVDNEYKIQTSDVKKGTVAYCSKSTNYLVQNVARKAFESIGAKHYMRIDMRIAKDGTPYVIDMNIFPGFGIAGYMYRCLLLNDNKSYKDFISEIINSAD